jgi:hypothetical protein
MSWNPKIAASQYQRQTAYREPRTFDDVSDDEDNNRTRPQRHETDSEVGYGQIDDDIMNAFENFGFSPKLISYTEDELQAAQGLLHGQNVLQLTNPVEEGVPKEEGVPINIKMWDLITQLFTLIFRLPLECARLFQSQLSSQNMRSITNTILTIVKQILLLIKVIISVPSKIGSAVLKGTAAIKQISIGFIVLSIISIMLYQTPATRPCMIFISSIIERLTGVDVPNTIQAFAEFIKQKVIEYFTLQSLVAAGSRALNKAANTIGETVADKVGPELSNKVITALNSNEAQNALVRALNDPRVLAGLTITMGPVVGDQMRLVFSENVDPQLTNIKQIVEGIAKTVNDIDIKSTEQLMLFNRDLPQLQKLISMAQNNQEITETQLKEITDLLNQNLQTTDLGRLMNARGVTPETVLYVLNKATATASSILFGQNERGQYLLRNEVGGRQTRRKRKKTKQKKMKMKTQKKQKKQKKQRGYKSIRHKRRTYKSKKN